MTSGTEIIVMLSSLGTGITILLSSRRISVALCQSVSSTRLVEILNRELEKFSAAGVSWHLSRDKKRTLCMFYVRYLYLYNTKHKTLALILYRSSEAENVLNVLRTVGIGHDVSSSIRENMTIM